MHISCCGDGNLKVPSACQISERAYCVAAQFHCEGNQKIQPQGQRKMAAFPYRRVLEVMSMGPKKQSRTAGCSWFRLGLHFGVPHV